jgi:glycosyltransferase involved in cell wall biosynthesis
MTNEESTAAGPECQPVISVIMNCYNGERYLREAIDSVLAQRFERWEIIFWDNQSTDHSADIFKSYTDVRLKYYCAPAHTLLYDARNYAIEKATGELIAFLDVDDWWHPEKLGKQILLFDDPTVGFACSNYWIVNEVGETKNQFRNKPIASGWVLNDLLMDYPIGMLTLILRRAAFDALPGGCDPRFHIIGDIDLVVRLAMEWKMASCQELLAYYRLHGENEGKKQKVRHVEEYKIWVKELEKNPKIQKLSGYKKVVSESVYMQGRLCVSYGRVSEGMSHLSNLPWGKYKIKLWISLAAPRKLLGLVGLEPEHL